MDKERWKVEQGILTIKLNELEQQYGKLLSRIQLYQERITTESAERFARWRKNASRWS